MLDVAVICSDRAFSEVLCDACRANENVRPDICKVTPGELQGSAHQFGVVLLVVENSRNWPVMIDSVLESTSDRRVIGVLRDDDPALAFDLIARGAHYVIAVPMRGNASVEPSAWEMLTQLLHPLLADLVSSQPPLRFLSAKLTPADQVFVSMRYRSSHRNSREEYDYYQAIVPSLKKLGVDVELSRTRRNRHGRTTNAKLLEEIHRSRVFLVQVSSMTDYVAYEFGAADSALRIRNALPNGISVALEEMIILRPTSSTLPAVAEGLDRLDYVNRTDLALKLFLGLGGTQDDLRRRV